MIVTDSKIPSKCWTPMLHSLILHVLTNLLYISDGPGDPSAPISPARIRKGKSSAVLYKIRHTICWRAGGKPGGGKGRWLVKAFC